MTDTHKDPLLSDIPEAMVWHLHRKHTQVPLTFRSFMVKGSSKM